LLQPLNFDALLQQHVENERQGQEQH